MLDGTAPLGPQVGGQRPSILRESAHLKYDKGTADAFGGIVDPMRNAAFVGNGVTGIELYPLFPYLALYRPG